MRTGGERAGHALEIHSEQAVGNGAGTGAGLWNDVSSAGGVHTFWLIMFVASSLLLFMFLFRRRLALQSFVSFGIHLIVGAIALFAVNLLEPYTQLSIPLNEATLATSGILGLPGVLLLVALKLTIL
ncbi:pro-sigmaK processing inhibitor BofA family protein [Paenibacillus sp. y28]|uniref:pro-sigmaK processing inhibitor BofA family protein n=1 Tax=Paenibacillus sp. y28 TaxID=3129110 RepID=UPI0030168D1C